MKSTTKKSQQSVSNFIQKTFNILENEENSQIVEWTPRGTSFIIKDIKKFEEHILPIYFKHSNFSSFVRQLNMYNFHKVRGDRLDCQFEHEKFRRGQRQLLSKIKRKQSESFIVSQNMIDQLPVHLNIQDSSENNKKYIQAPASLESLAKEQARHQFTEKSQYSFEELQKIKKENKNLKMLKQSRVQKQKLLNTSGNNQIGQKFFKLVTCLLAEKLQKQLRIDRKSSTEHQISKTISFDQIIEHILSNGQPALQFFKYTLTAKSISAQQSDCDFMIRKTGSHPQALIKNNNIGLQQ